MDIHIYTYIYICIHTHIYIQEENERVGHYLDMQTRKPLIAVLDSQLLQLHVQAILDKVSREGIIEL